MDLGLKVVVVVVVVDRTCVVGHRNWPHKANLKRYVGFIYICTAVVIHVIHTKLSDIT